MMKDIFVPNIGDFDEVEIIEIHVSLGEKVEIEQSLITLESDKATMDIPSPMTMELEKFVKHILHKHSIKQSVVQTILNGKSPSNANSTT